MKSPFKQVNSFFIITFAALLSFSCAACAADAPNTSAQESAGQYLDNSVLTGKVKSKLLAEPSIKSLPITVTSYKNTVQLSGFVDSASQEALAVKIAESVPGVSKVENNLSLKK